VAFLIRTIDFTAAGREIVRDRTLDQSAVTIGRAADNDIHLPDLAVEQRHVRLTDAGGGMIGAEAITGLGFAIDGKTRKSATIDPAVGAEIALGSARLAIGRAGEDGPVQITVSQVEANEGAADALQNFALTSALPSKRAMAWGFAATILILLLSVPIFTHLTRTPVTNDPENVEQGQVLFDAAWSSGELSMAHHDLEDNCEACHQTAFISVQDKTCLTCHEDLNDHAEMPRQRLGMPAMSWGDQAQWTIAETLGKEGPLGCVSCHSEHEGPVKLEASSEQFCADCHDNLDARLTDVSFGNADDFGDKHPQFRPLIYTAHFSDEPMRVSLDRDPVEKSGLLFPHDIHVSEDGGAARMAISLPQYGAPLECSDCHEEDAGAPGGYAPVVMEDSCEACHSLVSGRSGAGFTRLRHGNVVELMEDLARVDRGPRRPVTSGRYRPGQYASGGRYFANFGRPMSAYIAINRALERGGTCGDCHIRTQTEGRPDLVPVNIPDEYLHKGWFPHDAHDGDVAECADCHATATSDEATDLLIPGLETCRDCHLGESAIETEEIVPSSCAMCHSYHTPTMPWRPEDHPAGMPGAPGDGRRDTVASILGSLRR
jgi:predicted CXXCH cytochrome family protein